MHQSYLRYRNFLWGKIALALCAVAVVAYLVHQPADAPNGGTWLGYTLGTLGAGIIGWLVWFGVRKRRYRADAGLLASWLSAHVYLGAALIVIGTLHCGFQFGWNVHTLAYVLMMIVILSGFYGVYAYARYPSLVTANRAQMSREAMAAEVSELDRECLTLSDQVGPDAYAVVLKSIEETVIGGTFRQQLFASSRRQGADVGAKLQSLAADLQRRITRPGEDLQAIKNFEATAITYLAGKVTAGDGGSERLTQVRRLVDLITRRRALVERLQRDVEYHARLQAWLYLHVPVSIGLLAALTAHIVSVFFYW